MRIRQTPSQTIEAWLKGARLQLGEIQKPPIRRSDGLKDPMDPWVFPEARKKEFPSCPRQLPSPLSPNPRTEVSKSFFDTRQQLHDRLSRISPCVLFLGVVRANTFFAKGLRFHGALHFFGIVFLLNPTLHDSTRQISEFHSALSYHSPIAPFIFNFFNFFNFETFEIVSLYSYSARYSI